MKKGAILQLVISVILALYLILVGIQLVSSLVYVMQHEPAANDYQTLWISLADLLVVAVILFSLIKRPRWLLASIVVLIIIGVVQFIAFPQGNIDGTLNGLASLPLEIIVGIIVFTLVYLNMRLARKDEV